MVAVTAQVYTTPLVRPVTVIGETLPVWEMPLQLTEYDVITLPPLDAGGVNAIDACAVPTVAVPIVGAPGTPPRMPKLCNICGAAR